MSVKLSKTVLSKPVGNLNLQYGWFKINNYSTDTKDKLHQPNTLEWDSTNDMEINEKQYSKGYNTRFY